MMALGSRETFFGCAAQYLTMLTITDNAAVSAVHICHYCCVHMNKAQVIVAHLRTAVFTWFLKRRGVKEQSMTNENT